MERLLEKIEAIRREPPRVRARYALFSVGVSMVLVMLLWMFSIYEGFRSVSDQPASLPDLNLPKPPSFEDISSGSMREAPTGEDFLRSEQMRKSVGNDAGAP